MQRPLYDQLVPYYEVIEGRDWRRETSLVASILRKYKARSVIDLGCGTGYHVRSLTKFGFDSTGVDISRKNILFARKKAREENVHPSLVIGSYYNYRPRKPADAALCLNWSIPTRDDGLRRFLGNTCSFLKIGGVLILDYERVSQIVWEDVGKPIINSWDLKRVVIVRVSLGQMFGHVLYSRDLYILYPKPTNRRVPSELARYIAQSKHAANVFEDCSYVRFYSMAELRKFGAGAGFRVVGNHVLPRNSYKRNYVVLKRVS
jgi:SAM-dependent methyltransferase